MAERCWAFLAADFDAAAREAETEVARLRHFASEATSRTRDGEIDGEPLHAWVQRQPEWIEAQRAIAAQITAGAALEEAGLPILPDALHAAQRAHAEFARLWTELRSAEHE